MWMGLIIAYVVGFLATAFFVYNDTSEQQSGGANAGMVVLWPLFWLLTLVTRLQERGK